MAGERGPSTVGERLSIAAVVTSVIAAIAVITLTVGTFTATTAPTGEAGKTKLWHDATTKKLMADVAAAGAKYVVMSPTSDVGGGGLSGLTTNRLTKATSATTVGDASIDETTSGVLLRPSPTAADASVAGNALTIQASPAVAGTVTAGAAPGGSVNITAGAAARNTSGNAPGGDIIATGGTGIGTGIRGTFQAPGAGTNSTAVGVQIIASGNGATALGIGANVSATYATGIGPYALASGTDSIAIGGGSNGNGYASQTRLPYSCNISKIMLVRKDNNELFNSATNGSLSAIYAGTQSVLFTNELDATQAAIANSTSWTVAVTTNVVTVDCKTPHKFSVGQYISTDADWTVNTFMASLTDKLITSVTANTFTFALTQANQSATLETNAGAGITPGDYVLTMPTGGSFQVTEFGVECSTLNGTITTQPTVRFGNSATRDAFRAASLTTNLTALRAVERIISSNSGQTTLACGMTAPAVLNSATSFKIRFYFKGEFLEDE